MTLNSYVGHTFQVRELAAKKTGVCGGEDETCKVDHFTVNTNQDQGEYISNMIVHILCSFFICMCFYSISFAYFVGM